jgi:short subunit dehydrogenase-like uncharacterized protein
MSVVLLGATGFTGRLVSRALFRRGIRPVLAARSAPKLAELAAELETRHGGTVETAVVDVAEPAMVRRLIRRGDVLVTTVGPFTRWGRVAATAAAEVGAIYLDSTGEPGFIRDLFDRYAAPAADSGACLLPAFGYDFVPGNLAAGLAVAAGGGAAARVDIGYFLDGLPLRTLVSGASSGTRASLLHATGEPGYAFRDGRLVAEPAGRRRAVFAVDGARRAGIGIGASEHLSLPRVYPGLREIGVYLGWLGAASRVAQALSYVMPAVESVPALGRAQAKGLGRLAGRFEARSGTGPSDAELGEVTSRVVALAYDRGGRPVGRAELAGANPYPFTAEMLAWAADRAVAGAVTATGVRGPLEAFEPMDLLDGARQAGLERVG